MTQARRRKGAPGCFDKKGRNDRARGNRKGSRRRLGGLAGRNRGIHFEGRRFHREHHGGQPAGHLPAGRCRLVQRHLQQRRNARQQPDGQRRLGHGARRADRQRHCTDDDHEQHRVDQLLRQLRLLQRTRPAVRRRLLPQHQQHRGGVAEGHLAREPGQLRPATGSRSPRSAGPAAATATRARSRSRPARSSAEPRRSARSPATSGPRVATPSATPTAASSPPERTGAAWSTR